MSPSDLQLLKASIDSTVELTFQDETVEFVRVISVFDQESDPDIFYTRLTDDGQYVGDYGAPLAEIKMVTKREIPSD